MSNLTARHAVATGLANAMLAGAWTQSEMVRQGQRTLGDKPAWLVSVVRAVVRTFREPPRDRRDELAVFIAAHPRFARAFGVPSTRPRIALAIVDEPAMGNRPWDVPAITTSGELAEFLGVGGSDLDWLADRRGLERFARDESLRNYVYTSFRKADGGVRVLEAPKERLKALQRRILHTLLDRIPPHGAAHGFRSGHSTVSFAAPHAGRPLVVRFDLEDFFTSVTSGRVFGIFRTAGYPESVARTLTALCTNRLPPAVWSAVPRPDDSRRLDARWRLGRRLAVPHLPQGAPTSPALANLVAYRLDVRLDGLARAFGLSYTRYADDLAFSGDRVSIAALAAGVRGIAADEGFTVRADKTRVRSAAQRQVLGGWVVNDAPNVPRRELDRLEAILTNCVRHGPAAQNRDAHPDFAAHLRGRIAWIGAARPDRAIRLDALFRRITW